MEKDRGVAQEMRMTVTCAEAGQQAYAMASRLARRRVTSRLTGESKR
jgi:hypothetical protein